MTQEPHATILTIEGMTCSSCVARVEKSLEELPGVTASVNLATKSAKVTFPDNISSEQLLNQVSKIGYSANLPTTPEDISTKKPVSLLERLIFAIILTVPVIVLAMVPAWQFDYWQWVSLLLATPVVLWCGYPIHRATFKNLRHGVLTMDTLVTLGTFAAYGWSVYALFFGMAGHIGMHHSMELFAWENDQLHNIYLEAAAGVTTFILLGRYLEEKSQRNAGEALRALAELTPEDVTVLVGGKEIVIPLSDLSVGQVFVVKPGQKIATDGIIRDGSAAVDESAITGESVPAFRELGQSVTGSTTVLDGRLLIEATAVGADTRIAQLAALVEDAQLKKSAIQKLADRISAVFVPIVVGLSIVTASIWLLLGAPASAAFTAAVAVLVIACPCALGLATPVALMVGTGRAAQRGIILSGPDAIEGSSKIRTILLDKTGTITSGNMHVSGVEIFGNTRQEDLLALVAAVESGSEHPIAHAIVKDTEEKKISIPNGEQYASVIGHGITATVANKKVTVGTEEFLRTEGFSFNEKALKVISRARETGASVVLAGYGGEVQACISVSDTIKDDSAEAIERLHSMGLSVVLLTGDHQLSADAVAKQVGITQVIAGATPERKLEVIQEFQQIAPVAMVGDGVNDAAALAQSDLGIAMGTGTDLAKAASDITLIRGNISAVADSLAIARKTLKIIHGNLFWAFAYNVAAIPLAAFGLLNPMLAGAAMAFSSVFVVLNSLRLKGYTPTQQR